MLWWFIMVHDVFICCDEENKHLGDEVYDIFKKNNIKSWIKSKDMSSNDSVDSIIHAISDSKCFVLIHSKNSNDTNYVVTETDIAFSRNIPIIVFNIDKSKMGRNLEFILEDKLKIDSFPNSKKQLEILVKETSKIIGNSKDAVKIDSKSVKAFEKINPNRRDNAIKKYIKIAIPIAIALILIYLFVILPTGQNTTDDGIFSMNVTDVDVSGSTYTVRGESYNMPSDSSRYFMNIKFFDKNDYMVYEVNSTVDEFKSGVICSFDVHTDNVTYINFTLTDIDNNVLSKQSYVLNE